MRARPTETTDSGGQRGPNRVALFVHRHEDCGGSFAVERQTRSGKGGVRIACAACGESADCDPSHPGLLKLADDASQTRRRKPIVSAEELQKWLPAPAALPWWVPNAYIGAIIAVGLALIAFGLVAPIERDDRVVLAPPPSQPPAGEPAEPPPSPPVNTGPAAASAAGSPSEPSDPESAVSLPPWVKRRGETLDRVEVANRFAIGVPSGWTGATADGAVVFSEPGRSAELRVFLEAGEIGLDELTRKAREYLADRRPGADILGPEPLRFAHRPAAALLAKYDGGDDRVLLLRSGGYAYLLLGTIEGGASRGVENDALAALGSFRPL